MIPRIPAVEKLLQRDETKEKILLYFSSVAAVGEDYDPEENNLTGTNLNPTAIKANIVQLNATSLVWKSYGLKEQGAVSVLCDKKYRTLFERANKIEYDGDEYQVFKEGTGGRSLITKRPYNKIRVLLRKV